MGLEIFFFLLIIPILSMLFCRWRYQTHYTMKEMGIQLISQVAICALLACVTYFVTRSASYDTEILNGSVTSKSSERVSCSHSYQCNCRTVTSGSGSSKTTKTVCDTCYEHAYDIDWVVHTTFGRLTIDRVNRQGTEEPPRFSKVKAGEPASRHHTYENFVKAVPDSIFNKSEFDHYDHIKTPKYPRVYDYYRVHHVVNAGSPVPKSVSSNIDSKIDQALITLGSSKQVNIIVVFTKDESADFAEALRYKWLNGKKNDVIVVVGANKYPEVSWVKSFGWAKSDLVNIAIEDKIRTMKINDDSFAESITSIVKDKYERRPFDEFKYLIDELSPPIWLLILIFILDIVATVAISLYFVRNSIKN